jgi:hypothetical protein
MTKLLTTICLALLALSVLAHAAKDEKTAPASFSPGAKVELLLSVACPKGWAHNPAMPIKLSFDEEYLKTAPFSIKESSISARFEGHPHSTELKIPITLSGKLPDGELRIPATVDAFICTEDESMCIMASETVSIRIMVQAAAGKGQKNQALDKGSLPVQHQLAMPE